MNEETRAELLAEIRHWRDNARAETAEEYGDIYDGYELCARFMKQKCLGCPVMQRTGKAECEGTPYFRATKAYTKWRDATPETAREDEARSAAHAAATAFADWLEALLPEDGK